MVVVEAGQGQVVHRQEGAEGASDALELKKRRPEVVVVEASQGQVVLQEGAEGVSDALEEAEAGVEQVASTSYQVI